MENQQLTVVRPILVCEECTRPWLDPVERWRMYVDPDGPRAVPYCPACSQREFGGD